MNLESAIESTIDYLSSERALRAARVNPYWPKWDSPRWHMVLLYEMGLADQIPEIIVCEMVDSLNKVYAKVFPFSVEDVPAGFDPYREIPCHCDLGTIYKVLSAWGVDVDSELAWIRPWFFKYQLPDGGLNCDESAYSKEVKKSSIVSSLPPLEAILFHTNRPFTQEECQFLDSGANYLLSRKLFRSLSTGNVIDQDWLKLCFPRFYDYDILRGLYFLVHWAYKRGKFLPLDAIGESIELIDKLAARDELNVDRIACAGDNTWVQDQGGNWSKTKDLSSFDLLESVNKVDSPSLFLTEQWEDTLNYLRRLDKFGHLQEASSKSDARSVLYRLV
jgi:hypothetical protein